MSDKNENYTKMGCAVIHSEVKIGDSLTSLPWLFELARQYRDGLAVNGNFHPAVEALLLGSPFHFRTEGPFLVTHDVIIRRAYDYANINGCHMAQGHFASAGAPLPHLPFKLKLYSAPCQLPVGAVICPFTASDESNSKLWLPDRWLSVVDHLVSKRYIETIYVIGSKVDDFAPYQHPNVVAIRDFPLPKILDLLRQAPIFASTDSGPSHLAHFGGIERHVLMAPVHVSAELARNPWGRIIHARPIDVTVEHMIAEIDWVLFNSLNNR